MAKQTPIWLDLQEVRTAFTDAGIAGEELVRMLAWACGSRRLIATGFRQISIGNDVASSVDRETLNCGQILNFVRYAFQDGDNVLGARATILEADWFAASFRYRIERDEGDDHPTLEVECWINWQRGEASYRLENGIQEVWRSILIDAPMAQVLARQVVERANLGVLQDWEIDAWIKGHCTSSDVRGGWKEFRQNYGKRTGKRDPHFVAAWKRVRGERGRGRPRLPPDNQ